MTKRQDISNWGNKLAALTSNNQSRTCYLVFDYINSLIERNTKKYIQHTVDNGSNVTIIIENYWSCIVITIVETSILLV